MVMPRTRRTSRRAKRAVTIICPTPGAAHALRHELDDASKYPKGYKMGALSKRSGRRVSTTASMGLIASARRKAKRSTHHGQTR
jgi:hypothetical protein